LDTSKYIQKAEEAARRRNYDFAVELYTQLLDIDPDQGDARAGLRAVLKKRHEAKKGGKLFRKLAGAGPLAVAKTMAKAGRHEACAKSLEQYLASNPLDVDANLLLGQSLETVGHKNSARAVYEFVAEIDPQNSEGLRRAGAMVAATGDHVKALEYYERALDADPRDQEALKARKNLAAETALAASGSDKITHSRDQIKNKGQAQDLERSQRMHRSDDELREDLARLEDQFADTPTDVSLMLRLAEVHEKLKDPEAALEFVERAAEYDRDSYEMLDRLGKLKGKVLKKGIARADRDGNAAKASEIEEELKGFEVENCERRVALRPGDGALRLELGRLLHRRGDHDQAIAELQKAMSDPRSSKDAGFYLAQSFQAKGFNDLARKEYERSLEGNPARDERAKEVLYNLGAIAEAEGKADDARSFYTRIFEVDIGYRDVADKMEQFR
jgi:tetratricopeptide (TPR) repeat protein